MSALIPASRVAGRRILKSAASKAQKHARRAAVDLPTVSSSAWSRKITTTSATSNGHGLQAVLVKDVVTLGKTDALSDVPRRPLPLSMQQTAARLADTLELLEGEIGGDPEWSRRIESALEELGSGLSRKGRLAVYGSPESGFRTVVTTLLADPLTQSDEARKAILDRANEEIGETFVTSYGDSVGRDVNGLVVDSPWLRDAAVDVHEVTTRDASRALSTLLESDVVLLVLDPVRLLDTPEITAILPDLLGKPDVYFIVNGEIESNGLRDVGASLDQELARRVTRKLLEDQLRSSRSAFGLATKAAQEKIVFLSTHKALRSMDALRSTLTVGETIALNSSEHAFAKFREEYLESNLGAVSAGLLGDIRAVRERADISGGVYEDTYAWLAESASRYIVRNLADVLDETREIEALCAQHADLLSRKRQELRRDTFTSGEAIKEEMDGAKRGVEEVLRKRLVWWKVMSWRVDMVAEEVGREVEERWAAELTQKLGFEAGRLQAIQKDLNAKMFDVLSNFSPETSAQKAPNTAHPYHSPLFLNRLQRLAFENDITPTSLLNPVLARRNQLLRFSVPMLQARAHKMTWTTISLSFLFSSAAWTTAVPLELITHSTGLAAGLLGSLASIRWGVGLWAKAQKKFWQDWSRAEEGLEEDLGGDLERLLGQVEGVGLAGLKGVQEMVVRRQKRAEKVDVALRQPEITEDRHVRDDKVVERVTA